MNVRLLVVPWLAISMFSLAGCAASRVAVTSEDYFKDGERYYAMGNYSEAISAWKKVKDSFSGSPLVAQAELNIADAQFKDKSYIEAVVSYEEFRKLHPGHEKAAYALYRVGLCYYNQIGGIDTDQAPVKNAAATLETFLHEFPRSEYADDVKSKLAQCRLKQAQYELYVGRFYFRTEKYQAAINRLEGMLKDFPGIPVSDEALYYLGSAQIRIAQRATGNASLNRLLADYPLSIFAEKARKELGTR